MLKLIIVFEFTLDFSCIVIMRESLFEGSAWWWKLLLCPWWKVEGKQAEARSWLVLGGWLDED